MKKITLIILLMMINLQLFGQPRLAQVVHKYVTWNAWEVVRHQHPEVIGSTMDVDRMGPGDWWNSYYDGDPDVAWYPAKILTGAFKEDESDVVFDYGGLFNANVTNTHFWDADEGDNWRFYPFGIGGDGYENSYFKLALYWTGHWGNGDGVVTVGWLTCLTIPYCVKISYNNLGDALRNPENIWVTHWWDIWTQSWEVETDEERRLIYYLMYNSFLSEAEARGWVNRVLWGIVGRMCHLIEDSGVPVHAHGTAHPYDDYEKEYISEYENVTRWTYANALEDGGLINLNDKFYPIRFVMYTTNQVADRFSSNGRVVPTPHCIAVQNGDVNYQSRFPTYGQNYDTYSGIIDSVYQRVTVPVDDCPDYGDYHWAIADNAYVFTMRAVAGFLWYVYTQSIPSNLYLQNITVNTGTDKRYDALNLISAAGPDINNNSTYFIMEPGSTVKFLSPTIRLQDGFQANYNSTLEAKSFTFQDGLAGLTNKVSVSKKVGSLRKKLLSRESERLAKDSTVSKLDLIPLNYFLSQNYPNPFNPSTTIKYGLKENVTVSLKIYDLLGKEVRTLVNEYQNAGYKSALWDGTDNNGLSVSSGVYFYKIVAGDFVDVKKMAIIK